MALNIVAFVCYVVTMILAMGSYWLLMTLLRRRGENVRIIVEGEAKEIAALVWELQERQPELFVPSDSSSEGLGTIPKCSCL